ncbi:MAG: type I secretion system permease/ATPase [Devosia sp.]
MGGELGRLLRQLWRSWAGVGILSGASNVLALSGSIFMLSVYDRVIPSGSVPTLIALGLLCLAAYGLQAFVDVIRSMMLTRVGLATKEALSPRVFDISIRNAAGRGSKAEPAKDLDQIQNFLSSAAPTAFFDLPWVPLYISICFLFHFWVGVFVTGSVLFLIGLAVVGELLSRSPSRQLTDANVTRSALLSAGQQQAEAVTALGMAPNLAARWRRSTTETVRLGQWLSDTMSVTSTVSKTTRMVVQSSVLALGAYLVIVGEASGGIMIASSILSARALAPIDLSIANWRSFLGARQSWSRLNATLAEMPAEAAEFVPLRPALSLTCEAVAVAPARGARPVLMDVSFGVTAGDCLAVLGPIGSGKSTFAKSLVGITPPVGGSIRLDGTSILQWPSFERGQFVGYLPQQVAMFEGTIAENIGRFDPAATAERVISASRAAGVHEMISRLPAGYATRLGPGGAGLSGGQAQRIGLARALYGEPFLVVLDEPNSSADGEGDAALLQAMQGLRERGAITVIVTHRTGVLPVATHVVLLGSGRMQRFGTAKDVLGQVQQLEPRRAPHAA